MDPIKEAFQRAKVDMSNLQRQIELLSGELLEMKQIVQQLATRQTDQQTNQQQNTTTYPETPTDKLTELHKQPLNSQKSQNSKFSTGNEGVPTDRQTDQQTDRPTKFVNEFTLEQKGTIVPSVKQLGATLESLDEIKRTLRTQFKQLTKQEMFVYMAIYQLEDEGLVVDYPILAAKLKLSESSIRDYALKIIRKGVPLVKQKENNKNIILKIPVELKQLASLQTLISLHEL